MTDRAEQLFYDYSYYRKHTLYLKKIMQEKPFLQSLKPTKQRLELLTKMVEWCGKKNIDPDLWLFSLFVVRRWKYAPRLAESHLLSEKHVEKFGKYKTSLQNNAFYRKYLESKKASEPPDDSNFDPNRDLSSSAEYAKRRYLLFQDSKTCMAQMYTETFGYHPKSMYCVYCPIKQKCCEKLMSLVNFDIVALRLGKITAREAHQKSLNGVQGYGRR